MELRIGHLSTFYHTAILLMAREDTNARLGAEVQWRLFGTGPAIVDALSRKELDLAYIGLPPAIIGISRGVQITCIAGGHMEGTVMTGKSHWKGLEDLADPGDVLRQFSGRTIGVPGRGSIHDIILLDCLERFGLSEQIAVRRFSWADLVTEALARDEIAAAFGTPALAVAARRFAGGKILIPAPRLWPNNPSYGILAERGFLDHSLDVAERFLSAHEEAARFMSDNPEEAADLIARTVNVVDREFVLETLNISPGYCAALPPRYIDTTMEFVRALHRLGYIHRKPGTDEIFNLTLIAKTHPEQEHYGYGYGMMRVPA